MNDSAAWYLHTNGEIIISKSYNVFRSVDEDQYYFCRLRWQGNCAVASFLENPDSILEPKVFCLDCDVSSVFPVQPGKYWYGNLTFAITASLHVLPKQSFATILSQRCSL